jgi:hypothetical protein
MHDDAGVQWHVERFRARAVRTGEGRLELQIRLFVRLIRIGQAAVPITQNPLPNGSAQNAMGGRAPPSNFCSHFAPAFTAFVKKASKSST